MGDVAAGTCKKCDSACLECAGTSSHCTVCAQVGSDDEVGNASLSFELQHAGFAKANGIYHLDGTAHGFNKFKHSAESLWIRHGANHRHWFLTPRDGESSKLKIYSVPVVNALGTSRPPKATTVPLGS